MREKGLQILLEILKCARKPLLLRFKDGRVEIKKKGPSFIRPQIFASTVLFTRTFYSHRAARSPVPAISSPPLLSLGGGVINLMVQ